MKFSIFTAEKYLFILHGQVYVMQEFQDETNVDCVSKNRQHNHKTHPNCTAVSLNLIKDYKMASNFVTKSKFLARGKPIFILHSGIKFKSREHYFQQIKFSPRIRIVIMNRFNDGNVLASRIYFVGVKMLLY